MSETHKRSDPNSADAPITDFSDCHSEIFNGLRALGELPALLTAAEQARQNAAKVVALFENVVIEHHAEEERELFPAVLASANPGQESDTVKSLIDRLTREHRDVEALWKKLEPGLKKAAKGIPAEIATADIDRLVRQYTAHATYEEAVFLPMSESILGRNANHMAALGLSLHMRRHPYSGNAYI